MTGTENTRVWGVWYGGSSYSQGEVVENLEYWDDIATAKDALLDRYAHGHWREHVFNYVNKPRDEVRTPAVGEDTEIHLFYVEVVEGLPDYYPDAILKLAFDEDEEAFVIQEDM